MVSHTLSNLQAALETAALGYRVVPVHGLIGGVCTCGETRDVDRHGGAHKPGKHPACPRGVTEATTDAATIQGWYENAPWLNVAIAPDDGVFVVDVDPKNGGDVTFNDWENEHGAMPLTPTVKTGSGGRHVYFRRPPGSVVKNRPVAKGVDVKTLGGYLIAPPSRHVSGHDYEWVVPLSTPLADAPDWLLALVTVAGPVVVNNTVREHGPVVATCDDGVFVMGAGGSGDDFDSHPGCSERRTETLWRLVGRHKRRGDDVDAIEALALTWNERNTPPLPVSKVVKQVRDLYRKPDTFTFADSSSVDSELGGLGFDANDSVCRMSYVVSPPAGDVADTVHGGTIGGLRLASTFTCTETAPITCTDAAPVTAYDLRHTTYDQTASVTASDLRHTTYDQTSNRNPSLLSTINVLTLPDVDGTVTDYRKTIIDDGTPTSPVDASGSETVESIVPAPERCATGTLAALNGTLAANGSTEPSTCVVDSGGRVGVESESESENVTD